MSTVNGASIDMAAVPTLTPTTPNINNNSSIVDTKDEMMMELMSSDALIHCSQFEVLSFEELDELRKVGQVNPASILVSTGEC